MTPSIYQNRSQITVQLGRNIEIAMEIQFDSLKNTIFKSSQLPTILINLFTI
jgi:hypothetical protein